MKTLGTCILAALLVSCGDSPAGPRPGGDNVDFRTDRSSFRFERIERGLQVDIPYAYTNRTGRTVYVVNCNGFAPPVLEKNTGRQWAVTWSGGAPACLSPAIEIPQGGTYLDTLQVYAADPGAGIQPVFADGRPQGTYRLATDRLLWTFDPSAFPFGPALPVELRRSVPFTLLTPDQPTP